MKLFFKLIIVALVLAVLLPFTILKDESGKPLMSFKDLKLPGVSLPELPDKLEVPDLNQQTGSSDRTLIYEWRDKDGNRNFTSEPPPPGVEYTTKGYDPNLNLIQSIKTDTETETAKAETEEEPEQKEFPLNISNPYSPEKIEKLFDDAQKVQELIDERMKQQEAIFNQNQ
ncbi:MAG: DUF4124 domain-containing protein [Gammaproteobacteria bacterium]|nr:DUF4124 domain-containing protein [Gammaproteobacteria bacterium]